MSRKKINHGFTLLEVLIALAIIGVLAALAIPAYQDYVTRTRVTEAFVFADAERIKIIEKRMEGSGSISVAFSEPTVDMTTLQWVPVANGNPTGDSVIGYILPAMDLPGLGLKDAFALEYLYNGSWRCVNATDAVGRNAVSANEALEHKYLPSSCRTGAGLLAAHPKAPAGCPPGTQKTQVKDANGKQQQVCQHPNTQVQPYAIPQGTPQAKPHLQPQITPQLQPLAQPQLQQLTPNVIPIVKPQLKKCPGTLKLGSDGRCHTSSARLPAQCEPGHDCGHHDPKCPVGQEHIDQTSVVVRDHHNPFGSTNNYATKTTIVSAQCVAKCKAGFVFNPNEPCLLYTSPSPRD